MHFLNMLVILLLTFTACGRQDSGSEKVIRDNTKAYEEAFNKKDVKALESMLAEDAVYVIPETGEVLEGREAIVKNYVSEFAQHPKAKIEISSESITFPSSDEAMEIAKATIKDDDEVVSQTAYRAFYEKKDGKWLISEVREVAVADQPKPSEHLKELEWLIGDWIDEDDDTTIDSHYQWDRNRTFITQKFSVTIEGIFDIEGKEIIGWDPIKKQIRSWIFDSDGGFGEGTWKKDGDSWVVETATTLADGRRASAVNVFTPVDKDKYTWQSTGRAVGGELLPDIDPVTVVRKKS